MFVCVCNAITETEVRAAIADGASTREAVTRACSAGGDCGACHEMIADMIEAHAPCTSERSGPLLAATALVRERERAA